MILSDSSITEEMKNNSITIEPFNPAYLKANGYDVHLGSKLGVYDDLDFDCKAEPTLRLFDIERNGFVLQPGELYLGVTKELIGSKVHIPYIDGKSSLGRLGMMVHITAGAADSGWNGPFTLEIMVAKPTRVYADMPIGQVRFQCVHGEVLNPYNKDSNSKYNESPRDAPVGSKMFRNYVDGKWL